MRLKSIIASAFTALMVACPVLAFSESADFDDSVPDTDETMTIDGTSSDYSVSAVLAPGDWTGTVTFECLVQ